jgi:hypothetical protein
VNLWFNASLALPKRDRGRQWLKKRASKEGLAKKKKSLQLLLKGYQGIFLEALPSKRIRPLPTDWTR